MKLSALSIVNKSTPKCCRDIATPNIYLSDFMNNFDFIASVKLTISKREKTIIVSAVDRLKAKLKKIDSVVSLLNGNK